jgi:putative oxidoreductase
MTGCDAKFAVLLAALCFVEIRRHVEQSQVVVSAAYDVSKEVAMIKTQTAPYAALLLRVTLGVMFLAHAALKIFVFTPAGFVHYFATLDLSALVAYVVLALEVVGGIALVLGIHATLFALPLAVEMLGTIYYVHGKAGWTFTSKGGGWEFPALWTAALVALFLLGDGAWALRPSRR